MSRTLRAMALLLILAACGGGYNSPPRNLDNACSIVSERPSYLKAFRATERRWGVPVHVQMATIHQESKFIGNARTPYRFAMGVIPMGRQSSAFGYAQALDGTWDEYRRETGKRSAKRDRIRDATDFMGWYMAKTRERNGIALHDARNQYLAYHEGHTGFARGSYNRKSWLVRVSGEVQQRANMYQVQLATCKRRGRS
ncbi:MAG: lytic transglycosylase [Rhodobacteraceae bacterium]|nr:lytic transglycosylase [Paracoccaceae bacterium]